MPSKFLVEGLDRLGKSSLIDGIQNRLGFHTVIHYEKPKLLDAYFGCAPGSTVEIEKRNALREYQEAGFVNMFDLISSSARIIFDRAHLGECVYAPLYRGYAGDYVFDIELHHGIQHNTNTRLILLTEDFEISRHFHDDGLSFDATKRAEEQDMFITAFHQSRIMDKRIICVTDPRTGQFRDQGDILEEALA